MARRRRSRRPRRSRATKSRARIVLPGLAIALGGLLLVNAAVRKRGGEVSLLSVAYVGERAQAVAQWCKHHAASPGRDADPRAAVRAAAVRHGVPVRLLLGVARAESDFVPDRISATGAMGLMQLMPATARELEVDDPFDSRQSADGGARYLKQLLRLYRGNVSRALAAYNAGPGRVATAGPLDLPQETRDYVARITRDL